MKSVRLLLLVAGAVLALATGCQSSRPSEITDADKLTRDEYIALVNTCRGMLLNPKLNLTEEQKEFLRTQAPLFMIDYTGHKQGKFNMNWKLPGNLTVSVNGDGKVLESSCRIRVSVANF